MDFCRIDRSLLLFEIMQLCFYALGRSRNICEVFFSLAMFSLFLTSDITSDYIRHERLISTSKNSVKYVFQVERLRSYKGYK